MDQRSVYSFKNGTYITNKWNIEHNYWEDKWIPSEEQPIIKSDSCKYFDIDFEDFSRTENWFDIIKIKCPYFTKVMNDQKWSEEVQKWMCIFIGRMMYEPDKIDDWSVVPFLIGKAGTGKSTILDNIIGLLYDPKDIGLVGKKISVNLLADKKIYMCPETREDILINDSEFIDMTLGRSVCVSEKGKASKFVRFKASGIFAGSILPDFYECMIHHIVVFSFEHKILNYNVKLGMKIQKEIAHIIQLCNKGYLDAVNKGHDNTYIHSILPRNY